MRRQILNPPEAEIFSRTPPDENAQRHIISLAADYLHSTMPRLPDYYATRTLTRYEETPQYDEGSTRVQAEPLHMVESSRATVLYRNGYERLRIPVRMTGRATGRIIT
jgi:hypothetical protein